MKKNEFLNEFVVLICMESSEDLDSLKKNLSFGIKIWLEFENQNILGRGWAKLLETINNTKEISLTRAAKECNYSYKYAWNILKRIEKRTGKSPVITSKGGSGGGGWIKLNNWGKYLLNTYLILSKEIQNLNHRLEKLI